MLGSNDRSIQLIHRVTSINPFFRAAFEWFQSGPLATSWNRLYRAYLRSGTRLIHNELIELFAEKLEPPEEVVVIATHFGLAHKLAAIKDRMQREQRVRVRLVVVVTDATFQPVWYVDGADLMVVPSYSVKDQFFAYGKSLGASVRIEVLPYPLMPELGRPLDPAELACKVRQFDATSDESIEVSIPISGAAVGTDYFLALMRALRAKSRRFRFLVVSKDAPYTRDFLAVLADEDWVDIHSARSDREIVNAYHDLLVEHVVSLEVTKPSEQAFKTLLCARLQGGVFLLFSEPVGKQERDNLDFLQDHSLIPSQQVNALLWGLAENHSRLGDAAHSDILAKAAEWRGVRLPADPVRAAGFIWWLLTSGPLARLLATGADQLRGASQPNIGPDGVARFWNLVASL
ncbi:MAG: hypothetical protein IT326_10410 [Anaerolineae bacterium]|nr:hypothetical protein [Anaerolineae bacterium]